jgi:hypothetical protein
MADEPENTPPAAGQPAGDAASKAARPPRPLAASPFRKPRLVPDVTMKLAQGPTLDLDLDADLANLFKKKGG